MNLGLGIVKTFLNENLHQKRTAAEIEKVKGPQGLNRATSEAAKPPICRQKPGYVYTVL